MSAPARQVEKCRMLGKTTNRLRSAGPETDLWGFTGAHGEPAKRTRGYEASNHAPAMGRRESGLDVYGRRNMNEGTAHGTKSRRGARANDPSEPDTQAGREKKLVGQKLREKAGGKTVSQPSTTESVQSKNQKCKNSSDATWGGHCL